MHFIYKNFPTYRDQAVYLFDAQFIGPFCIEQTIYSCNTKKLNHGNGSIDADENYSKLEIYNMKQVHLPSNCTENKPPPNIFDELVNDLNNASISSIIIIFKGKIKMTYLKSMFNNSKIIFKTFPGYFTHNMKCLKGVLGGELCSLSNVNDMINYYFKE